MNNGDPKENLTYKLLIEDELKCFLSSRRQKAEIADLALQNLLSKRKEIKSLLAYYGEQLDALNPAVFAFLTDAQQDQLLKQLRFTLSLYAVQFYINKAEGRKQRSALASSIEGIELCNKRMDMLRRARGQSEGQETDELKKDIEQIQSDIAQAQSEEKPGKYLGYFLGLWLVRRMMELIQDRKSKTGALVYWMSEVNYWRLYWVWGGGMLSSILELLPKDFLNNPQAKHGMSIPSPYTGYMSWVLYYTRFAINLGLLLKHTINGPWMSPEEAKIPAWERFKTQWDQRKFALLNDSIWATANLVCFFWLRGAGLFGYAGNVVTAGLLLMDVALTVWMMMEESTKHNAEIEGLTEKRNTILRAIAGIEGQMKERSSEDLLKQKAQLEAELRHNEKVIRQSQTAWKFKRYSLANDLFYACGLLTAFCLFSCFFFPPAALAPALILIMAVVGAALCFTFTVLRKALSGAIDVAKSNYEGNEAREECLALIKMFQEAKNDDAGNCLKAQLYFEMKSLMAKSEHQKALAKYQIICTVRSLFIDTLIPILIFSSFMFMPLGIGLGVIAAGLALALVTHIILSRFAPKPNETKEVEPINFEAIRHQVGQEVKDFEAKLKVNVMSEQGLLKLFPQPKTQSSFFSCSRGSSQEGDSNDELNTVPAT